MELTTAKTNERGAGWIITATGRMFWPMDPRPEEVFIEDIAHALSNVCRFGGHCREFYSVAQHSVMVSLLCPSEWALVGLLHDATEAYIGDMVRPIKWQLPNYKAAEDKLWLAIAERFFLDPEMLDDVKPADEIALMTEKRDLILDNTGHEWTLCTPNIRPNPWPIMPMSPKEARNHFMDRFHEVERIRR